MILAGPRHMLQHMLVSSTHSLGQLDLALSPLCAVSGIALHRPPTRLPIPLEGSDSITLGGLAAGTRQFAGAYIIEGHPILFRGAARFMMMP